MRVIGTAGHVDHGKSSLIEALTGVHPDRLVEEQKREMTIELGFAWLKLPGGEEIGIVDVPGHRDFIGNMLAGVGGIDAVMLIIAADEGVMPQTREHLAILDLLQVSQGLIVISKTDMIDDPEWLELVEFDIRKIVSGTSLANAPIIRVSSKKKVGLENLLISLEEVLQKCPERIDYGRPRLPIDRVFSISGFGTIVTGTLSDGSLFTGEEVEIFPSQKKGRIRGLQNHKNKEEQAIPGSRTAVNISGINTDEIRRGDILAHRNQYKPTRMMDVSCRLLPDLSGPLKHAAEVKIYLGTAEIMAKVRLLGTERLDAGQKGWLQLELNEPTLAVRGDRFILRRPSPGETIGGGVVVEPFPKSRYKRFSKDIIKKLEILAKGTPNDILYNACSAYGPAPLTQVILKTGLNQTEANTAFLELINSGKIVSLEINPPNDPKQNTVITNERLSSINDQIELIIKDFHKSYPLKPGMAREELRNRLKLETSVFNMIIRRLNKEGKIFEKGSLVGEVDFKIQFTLEMENNRKRLLEILSQNPFSPPSIKECIAVVNEDVFQAMVEMGDLVKVSPDVVFRKVDFDEMVSEIKSFINKNGQISVAETRDLFKTSRKYVLALLEYMDSKGITIRDNDIRRLRK